MALASLKAEEVDAARQDVETGNTDNSMTDDSGGAAPRRSSGVEKLTELMKEQGENFDQEMPTPGDVTMIESLQEYNGQNIYEKVDSMIKAHQVVLVNRSWCLFSIDAVDFLSRMGVSVHSFEVDNHPHEAAIVKHLKTKYSHDT